MYEIIALISAWIRQFYLPNPFVNIIDPSYADIFNIIIGGAILHITSFLLCGCAYNKGIDAPIRGIFGYLISYIILTFIITIIGKLCVNYKIEIVLFLIIYIGLCIFTTRIFEKNKIKI